LLAIAAGILVTGTIAYVNAHGGDLNLIHACVQNNSSGLNVRIVASDEECKKNETAIHWGIQGPAGDTGPQGPRGEQGEQGEQGEAGDDGIDCWDLNENETPDITHDETNEDVNGDGSVDVLDCKGPQGEQGEQGPPGESAGQTQTSLSCSSFLGFDEQAAQSLNVGSLASSEGNIYRIAVQPDDFIRIFGFRVEISPSPQSDGENSWKSVSGGEIIIDENGLPTVGELVLVGPLSPQRQDLLDWYHDSISGDPSSVFRTVDVTLFDREGVGVSTRTYHDAFLVEYALGELNAQEADVQLMECVVIKVGFVEGVLD